MRIKVGSVVRAPWRIYGDDQNLTGVVTSVRKGMFTVLWNGDGDVTPAGDGSTFEVATFEAENIVSY